MQPYCSPLQFYNYYCYHNINTMNMTFISSLQFPHMQSSAKDWQHFWPWHLFPLKNHLFFLECRVVMVLSKVLHTISHWMHSQPLSPPGHWHHDSARILIRLGVSIPSDECELGLGGLFCIANGNGASVCKLEGASVNLGSPDQRRTAP